MEFYISLKMEFYISLKEESDGNLPTENQTAE